MSANELFKMVLKLKNIKNKNYTILMWTLQVYLNKDKDGVHFSQLHL